VRALADSEAVAGDGDQALTESTMPARHAIDLATITTQDDFGHAAFELLREASTLVVMLVHAVPAKPFERDEAIRRGLVKRLALLSKSLLSDICHDSGYQQEVLAREIVEAAANYLYLADDDEAGKRYDAYVLNTLAEEKASLAIVTAQVAERGGDSLPIEERMRRSIERMASAAGFSYDDVPGKSKIEWPSAMERLSALGPVAYMPYRTGSNAIHSGWTALLLRDIEQVEGGFTLGNGPSPAVQSMTSAAIITAETASRYLEVDGTDAERHWFEARLEDVVARIWALDEAHEHFMQDSEEEANPS
jgi:Family of unknown function (DUF5677)